MRRPWNLTKEMVILDSHNGRNRFSLAKNSTNGRGGYSHIPRMPGSHDSEGRPSPNIDGPGCLVLNIVGAVAVATRKTQRAAWQREPPFVDQDGQVQQAHPGWASLEKADEVQKKRIAEGKDWGLSGASGQAAERWVSIGGSSEPR